MNIMITLNLIPENEKKEIRLLNIYLAIKSLIFIFLFTLITTTIILLVAKITLHNYFVKSINENHISTLNIKLSGGEIKRLKTELIHIKQIQNDHTPWIVFFFKLNDLIPEGIVLSQLTLGDDNVLTLGGLAKKRQNLLMLQDTLQKSGYFENIKLPYDILFEKENIKFNLQLPFYRDKIFQQQ